MAARRALASARRAAWVAAQTAGDAFLTSVQFFGDHVGLRGGAVKSGHRGPQLDGYRFVADATATGTFLDHRGNGVVATITIRYRGVDYPVHVCWSERSRTRTPRPPARPWSFPHPGPRRPAG